MPRGRPKGSKNKPKGAGKSKPTSKAPKLREYEPEIQRVEPARNLSNYEKFKDLIMLAESKDDEIAKYARSRIPTLSEKEDLRTTVAEKVKIIYKLYRSNKNDKDAQLRYLRLVERWGTNIDDIVDGLTDLEYIQVLTKEQNDLLAEVKGTGG